MRLCLFSFYVKVPARTFLRSENRHLPSFDLELAHPQHATHYCMQPKVSITSGRAIRIPQYWTERFFDLQIHPDEELVNLNEFAIYVISRYYPLIFGE